MLRHSKHAGKGIKRYAIAFYASGNVLTYTQRAPFKCLRVTPILNICKQTQSFEHSHFKTHRYYYLVNLNTTTSSDGMVCSKFFTVVPISFFVHRSWSL